MALQRALLRVYMGCGHEYPPIYRLELISLLNFLKLGTWMSPWGFGLKLFTPILDKGKDKGLRELLQPESILDKEIWTSMLDAAWTRFGSVIKAYTDINLQISSMTLCNFFSKFPCNAKICSIWCNPYNKTILQIPLEGYLILSCILSVYLMLILFWKFPVIMFDDIVFLLYLRQNSLKWTTPTALCDARKTPSLTAWS